jgi:hypothetical protein
MVEGVASTVVDVACFPGSSGSPVFIYNTGSYVKKNGDIDLGRRLLFLGVLFAGPQIEADGKIVIRTIPTDAQAIAQIKLMMNLGYVIKARELEALGSVVTKLAQPESPQ